MVGNESISTLNIGGSNYLNISFTGGNDIDLLSLDSCINRGVNFVPELKFYFGNREKIDLKNRHCLEHRELFTTLKHLASLRSDTQQVKVLGCYLEQIEFKLAESWQDWAFYFWRRYSSNFGKSWCRPIILLVLGFIAINAVFLIVAEKLNLNNFVDLIFRSPWDIIRYEQIAIIGSGYDNTSICRKLFLGLIGFVQLIWVGMCVSAFVNSVKRRV